MNASLLFIGMPCSGKTTIGGRVAEMLGLPFVDFDEIIARRKGLDVPEIFELLGEPRFRQMEKELAIEFSRRGGLILSPGGGVVERPDTMAFLTSKAVVCRLTRDPSLITREGRPLLARPGAVETLLRRREPLYRRYADFTVDNSGTVDAAASLALRGYLEAIC